MLHCEFILYSQPILRQKGFGVDFGELVAVASGLPASPKIKGERTPESLADAVSRMSRMRETGIVCCDDVQPGPSWDFGE